MSFTFEDMKEKIKYGINYGNALECFDDGRSMTKNVIENEITENGVYYPIRITHYDYSNIQDDAVAPIINKFNCPEEFWGNPQTTVDIINFYKNLGFTAIRLPVNMTWYHAPGSTETYSGYLKYVKSVIKMINDAGMFCVVSLFCEGYNNRFLNNGLDKYKKPKTNPNIKLIISHWSELSSVLADIPPEKLAYDLLNEFSLGGRDDESIKMSCEIISKIYAWCIEVIRSNGGYESERLIGIGGFRGDANYTYDNLDAFKDILTDNKVFISVAMYLDPAYTFCYKDLFTTSSGNMAISDIDVCKAQSYLRGHKKLKSLGYNMIVTEYGAPDIISCKNVLNDSNAAVYANNMIILTAIERIWQLKLGIPAFYWDNGSVFDRYNTEIKIPIINDLIHIGDSGYSEMMEYYSTYIKEIGDE